MADKLIIETQLLEKDIKSIEEQIALIKNALASLKNDGARLQTMWEGSAKNAFVATFNDDCAQLEGFISLLQKYDAGLTTADKAYNTTAQNVSNTIKALKI